MSGYSLWLGMQHKIPDRSRIYGSSRTWLVSKTICLQNGRSPYTEWQERNCCHQKRSAFRRMIVTKFQQHLCINRLVCSAGFTRPTFSICDRAASRSDLASWQCMCSESIYMRLSGHRFYAFPSVRAFSALAKSNIRVIHNFALRLISASI